jgi:acetylornithine deacetylase/succinyl-diaminopimelate desuccinylase-like protein
MPVATVGVGDPGAQEHAPNEHMVIENFTTGVRHTAHVLEAFGRMG